MLAFLAGSAGNGIHRELLDWALAAGAECLEVSEAVLGKLAAKDNPQTMLGVFEQRWAAEPDVASVAADALWVVLEGPRDPGNLGTIVRTADAVGASGVALVGACVDPYSREAVRASMGSIFNVPLARFVAGAASWPGLRAGRATSSARTSAAREDFRAVRLSRAYAAADGQRGPGPVARARGRLHAARQNPDGRPPRFAQPGRGNGADAVRDAQGEAEDLTKDGSRIAAARRPG